MPRFFFDLFFSREVVLDPGGMLFEGPTSAMAAADEMARHLFASRAALRNCGSSVRVRDEHGVEIYRVSIDPDLANSNSIG
jgi:hypothetical protein